jgi:hypothetical protein
VLAFAYAVFEDLSDHRRVLDAGDNFHCAATVLTGFDVDPEHALETSGPGHGTVFFRFCQVRVGGESLTAPCRGDLRAKAAVRGEEPVIAREIDAGSGHECRQSGNKIQWLEEDVGGAVSPGCLERVLLTLTTREQRETLLEAAKYNSFLLRAEDVIIDLRSSH